MDHDLNSVFFYVTEIYNCKAKEGMPITNVWCWGLSNVILLLKVGVILPSLSP